LHKKKRILAHIFFVSQLELVLYCNVVAIVVGGWWFVWLSGGWVSERVQNALRGSPNCQDQDQESCKDWEWWQSHRKAGNNNN